MRNIGEAGRGSWATYIKAARQRVGLTQIAFARALGIDRATVYRWENSRTRPDDLEMIRRIAEVTGIEPEEVLAAAGLKLDATAPAEPTRPVDEELELILTAKIPERYKRELLDQLEADRAADRQRRLDHYQRLVKLYGRGA